MNLPFKPQDLVQAELPSGAKVLALSYRKLPLLYVVLMLRRGAEGDPEGEEGLADLTAEALTFGTREKGPEELVLAVERLGASFSASSGWDGSFLQLSGLSEDLEELVELAREIYLEPSFPPEEVQRAVERRVARLVKSRDEAERVADELIWKEAMEGTPYAHPTYGTLSSVNGLNREKVQGFYSDNYTPKDTVLLLLGNEDPEALLDRGKGVLEGWQSSSAPSPPKGMPSASQGRKIILVDRPDLTQSQIRIAFCGLSRKDGRYLAFKVMNYILGGGGFSSRLMQRVRSERGYTYGIRSTFHPLGIPGPLIISTFTPTESTASAFEEVLRMVEEFSREGPGEEELQEAKSYYRGNFPLRLETPTQLAKEVLELELYGLPLEELSSFPERVGEVKAEEVIAVAREFLSLDAFRAVVIGRVEAFEEAFKGLGSVEVRSFEDVSA